MNLNFKFLKKSIIFPVCCIFSTSLYSLTLDEFYSRNPVVNLPSTYVYGLPTPNYVGLPDLPQNLENNPSNWQQSSDGTVSYIGEPTNGSDPGSDSAGSNTFSTNTPNFTLNNDLPHNSTGGFSGDIIGVGSIGPNGNQLYDFNATVSQSSDGDQDNDVPTLLSIRAKMEALEKETRGNKNIVKNPVFNSETNQTDWETESSDSETTLADIHTELQKLVLLADRGNNSDSITESRQESVEEIEEQHDQQLSDIEETLSKSVILSTPSTSDHSSYYITLPSILTERVAGLPSSIDLFAIDIGGIQLPTLADLASFVSLVCGLIAIVIYIISLKSIFYKFLEDLPKMTESMAVTNYSVAGFSLGALGMFALKFSILTVFLSSVYLFINTTLNESIGFGTHNGYADSIVQSVFDTIATLSNWAEISVYWLFKFIPLVSITGMLGTFFTAKATFLIIVVVGNRGVKLAS